MAELLGIPTLIGDKRDEILRLAKQRGASNVRVFGSVARQEAGEDSDIDILVTFRAGYRLLDHAGLVMDLQELLGRHVDVAIESNLRDEMRDTILRDAIPL
ncbi:MAG: nucleotidyltransferase family protein [Anaerolineaceae bacterium]|nr:nucleotidyltransferase family protein [Anaerolineaceae bacterium]